MPVILTDFENLVSPNNEAENINFFVSPNKILSDKSFGLTLFDITDIQINECNLFQ